MATEGVLAERAGGRFCWLLVFVADLPRSMVERWSPVDEKYEGYVSQLVTDFPEIAEIDINPLLVRPV